MNFVSYPIVWLYLPPKDRAAAVNLRNLFRRLVNVNPVHVDCVKIRPLNERLLNAYHVLVESL